jgi:hypothetical protein
MKHVGTREKTMKIWGSSKGGFVRSVFSALCVVVAACSRDMATEEVGATSQAVVLADRILNFEGPVGPTGDWHAVLGTAAPSNLYAAGSSSKSLSLSGDWNPSAASVALDALGTLSSAPTIEVRLPSGYQCQGSTAGRSRCS